ncbi:hypothetical protein NY78_2651 [Desulfovibrio sp. TomC]|nr:hypothetical protein NY78_2651 [Desulfovibrio sp. TomC]
MRGGDGCLRRPKGLRPVGIPSWGEFELTVDAARSAGGSPAREEVERGRAGTGGV